MISIWLLLACLFWAGLALLVFELLWYPLEKAVARLSGLSAGILEETGLSFFISKYITQFAFLVVLPSVVYSWLYILVPFSGIRAGIGMALFLFVMGVIPFTASLLIRLRISLAYILFNMAGFLIKLIIVYAIISHLYVL